MSRRQPHTTDGLLMIIISIKFFNFNSFNLDDPNKIDFFSTHIQGHENNDLISGLRNQVSELKSVCFLVVVVIGDFVIIDHCSSLFFFPQLSLDIGEEIKEHNRFLKDMDNDFDSTWGTLTNSMNRLKKIASSGNHRYIWYLLLFSLFVFFVIWLIIRF